MAQMSEEPGVVPEGPYTAWSTPNGERAEVRGPGYKRVITGEMAYADAVRIAGDFNAREQRRPGSES